MLDIKYISKKTAYAMLKGKRKITTQRYHLLKIRFCNQLIK